VSDREVYEVFNLSRVLRVKRYSFFSIIVRAIVNFVRAHGLWSCVVLAELLNSSEVFAASKSTSFQIDLLRSNAWS
jgi:hypothetical protein